MCLSQCLLVLERLCMWVSGGEELCVWNKDFQLQCYRQNHSDTGEEKQNYVHLRLCRFHMQLINVVFVFWHFCRNNCFDRAAEELHSSCYG